MHLQPNNDFFRCNKSPLPIRKWFGFGLLFFSIAGLIGCQKKLEVRVYNAPKQKSKTAESKPMRSLAALVPHRDSVFFLKAMDQPSKLEPIAEPLAEVVRQMEFTAAGRPKWKLPEGWKESPGSGMSLAVLEAPVDGGTISITVTELPKPADQWEKYVEDNVNRWRGQLSLPPLPFATQQKELKEIAFSDEASRAYLVDITGTRSQESPMGGPMSGGPMSGGPMSGGTPDARPQSSDAKSPLQYNTPEGWTFTGTGPFRLASFEIVDGERKGEVTVSAARDDAKGNAVMWQSQLMQDVDPSIVEKAAEAALEKAEPITSPLGQGKIYTFRQSEAEDSQALMIAVIQVEGAGASLFAKVKGEFSLVTAQKSKLIAFVESFKVQ